MLEDVEKILNNDVEEVIKSPQLSLSLLKCYSKLYLNGAQPRVCAVSQRKYYSQLKIDGMAKAKIAQDVKDRTCVPKWKGNCYSSKACKHYNSDMITDGQAIDALEKGFLMESQFNKLPENYGNKIEAKSKPKAKSKKSE